VVFDLCGESSAGACCARLRDLDSVATALSSAALDRCPLVCRDSRWSAWGPSPAAATLAACIARSSACCAFRFGRSVEVVAAAVAAARAGPEDLWFDEVLGGATGGMPRWYSGLVTFVRELAESETTGD
jgi:hypothetical protein